jgi:hypothetical protein
MLTNSSHSRTRQSLVDQLLGSHGYHLHLVRPCQGVSAMVNTEDVWNASPYLVSVYTISAISSVVWNQYFSTPNIQLHFSTPRAKTRWISLQALSTIRQNTPSPL